MVNHFNRFNQRLAVEIGRVQSIHEVIGQEHLFPGGHDRGCRGTENGMDTPLRPLGAAEIFVQHAPETLGGRFCYPRDTVVGAFLDNIPRSGCTVVVKEVIEISPVLWLIIFHE